MKSGSEFILDVFQMTEYEYKLPWHVDLHFYMVNKSYKGSFGLSRTTSVWKMNKVLGLILASPVMEVVRLKVLCIGKIAVP